MVADTFLAAFRRRDRYDLNRPDARPWLYGIAGNLIGRHRRVEIRSYRALAGTGADEAAESYADRVDARVSASAVQRTWPGRWSGSRPGTGRCCCYRGGSSWMS
ncbi:DNA-directed RNA polymerase sigma-70 factor [Planomonospora sphaerica]|uniref:DNA-directed RNA polymerase sigma-70 factor n=1 Tax=Planomonospora sphaerica TaxID=161355 RepID=A0A171DNC5_9ACTN|nr:sigma factor [Planomonospora sphaerica]GAT70568.1 DNA-directed RNA polymerase sigma-70 factor [Planomonospora sphaerica]